MQIRQESTAASVHVAQRGSQRVQMLGSTSRSKKAFSAQVKHVLYSSQVAHWDWQGEQPSVAL